MRREVWDRLRGFVAARSGECPSCHGDASWVPSRGVCWRCGYSVPAGVEMMVGERSGSAADKWTIICPACHGPMPPVRDGDVCQRCWEAGRRVAWYVLPSGSRPSPAAFPSGSVTCLGFEPSGSGSNGSRDRALMAFDQDGKPNGTRIMIRRFLGVYGKNLLKSP